MTNEEQIEKNDMDKILQLFPIGINIQLKRTGTKGSITAKIYFDKKISDDLMKSNTADVTKDYKALEREGVESNVIYNPSEKSIEVTANGEWDDTVVCAIYDLKTLLLYDYGSEAEEMLQEMETALEQITFTGSEIPKGWSPDDIALGELGFDEEVEKDDN